MTQETAVLNHLKEKGSITSLEAIRLYGATRLSAIIYILRKKQYKIRTETITYETKYGNRGFCAKYILEEVKK